MANIPVNRQLWEALNSQQREDVQEALRKAGALKEQDTIVAHDDAPALADTSKLASIKADAIGGTASTDCISECFYSYSMAEMQCGDIPDRAASQACSSAAYGVLQECLKNCNASSA